MKKLIIGIGITLLTTGNTDVFAQSSQDYFRLFARVRDFETRLHRQEEKIEHIQNGINTLLDLAEEKKRNEEENNRNKKKIRTPLKVDLNLKFENRLRDLERGYQSLRKENHDLIEQNTKLQAKLKKLTDRSQTASRSRSTEPVPERPYQVDPRVYDSYLRRNLNRGIVVGPHPGQGSSILVPTFRRR